MAKLKGILPLEGTVGNITFLKTQDGVIARQKGGVSADRIASDPAFARTRENGQEFGRAGKGAKLLRSAFRTTIHGGSDGRVHSRLLKLMMAAIKKDQNNPRGQRTVAEGIAAMLEGFDFNRDSSLDAALYAPYTKTITRATGQLEVNIPSFNPAEMVAAPQGATHFRITAAGASVDFERGVFETDVKLSAVLPWDNELAAALQLKCTVAANSTHPLCLVLGLEFFQEVSGQTYSLKNGAYNALRIVKVDA